MQFPITIGLHRSHILDAGVLVVVVLATGLLLAWPQSLVVRLPGLVMAWLAGFVVWGQLVPSLVVIRLERSGEVLGGISGQQDFVNLEVLTGAIVHPWLTVVRLRNEQGKLYNLVVTGDTMDSLDFRRLRVFLRWKMKVSAVPRDA